MFLLFYFIKRQMPSSKLSSSETFSFLSFFFDILTFTSNLKFCISKLIDLFIILFTIWIIEGVW